MLFFNKAAIPASLTLILLSALTAHAQQNIAIGTNSGSGNTAPFGADASYNPPLYAAGGEYQEIYSSANFKSATPFTISAVAFASSNAVFHPVVTATYNVTIGFSTTSATVGAFSTASGNFANNRGTDYTTVFNGTVTATLLNSGVFDLVFPTQPFLFDPSKGNLLFDVVLNARTQANGDAAFSVNDTFQTERVYQSFGSGQAYPDYHALYTQFTVTPAPVPEASTTVSLGLLLALGAGAVAVRRKRAASAR